MIVVLASLTLLSVQPRHASKAKQELELEFQIINQANEPDDHYPLTCTTKWRLDAWEFEYSGTGLESIVPPLACLNESVNQILGVCLLMCALKLG